MTQLSLGIACSAQPICKSTEALVFWDVPAYAEHTAVKAKRVDAFVEHKTNKVKAVEMFFSWVEPSEKKSQETAKYGPL